jgi:hypothetical protein
MQTQMLRFFGLAANDPPPPPPPANPPPAQPEVIMYPSESEDNEDNDNEDNEDNDNEDNDNEDNDNEFAGLWDGELAPQHEWDAREEAVRAAKRARRGPALGGAAREPEPAAAGAEPVPNLLAPCANPTCKEFRRHCAVCDKCLSPKGSRVCKATDQNFYCLPGCTPPVYWPAAFEELYRMHDRQLAQIDNLRAEREVNRAETRQLQADLNALQQRSGMCETCERHTPQCIICLKRPAELAVLPCGHRVYCTAADCKPAPAPGATCPVCSGPRLIVQRIF